MTAFSVERELLELRIECENTGYSHECVSTFAWLDRVMEQDTRQEKQTESEHKEQWALFRNDGERW